MPWPPNSGSLGQAVPAQLAELPVGVLESGGRAHAAVLAPARPLAIADGDSADRARPPRTCRPPRGSRRRCRGLHPRSRAARRSRRVRRVPCITNCISASGGRYWLMNSSVACARSISARSRRPPPVAARQALRGSLSCRACRRWSSGSRRRSTRGRAPRTSKSCPVRRSPRCDRESPASVGGVSMPALATTNATGRSPHLSSGTPTTAASATPGTRRIRSSMSSEDTHSPPVFTTSLMRSTIFR